MALMTANSVKLLDPLKDPLAGYGKTAQGGLADALGTITNQAKKSQIASGRTQGQYTGQALGNANSMASMGINDTLAGLLGGASLKDAKAQQEFERQMALAREIGDIAKPSTLQEIISGLSGAAGTAGQGYSLYNALKKPGMEYAGGGGNLPPSLSLYPGGGASQYYGRGGY